MVRIGILGLINQQMAYALVQFVLDPLGGPRHLPIAQQLGRQQDHVIKINNVTFAFTPLKVSNHLAREKEEIAIKGDKVNCLQLMDHPL